jgi:predicted DCC family thiol-disulfide oxidoreductase YuxK
MAEWPMQVFYDGACPICRREAESYRKRDVQHRMEWVDIARPGFEAAAYGLEMRQLQRAMHVRMADGRVRRGVAAVVKIWEALPGTLATRVLRWWLKVPGMMAVAEAVYRAFARNRYRLTGRCAPEGCG